MSSITSKSCRCNPPEQSMQYRSGGFFLSIDFLSSALDVDPYLFESYGFRGIAHFQLEYYQAALDDFNNALALESTLKNVCFFRGLYFIKVKVMDIREKMTIQYCFNKPKVSCSTHCVKTFKEPGVPLLKSLYSQSFH